MIDVGQLLSDTGALVALLALPLVAFGAIFLLAYDRELGGQLFGFGKRTFLLLTLAAFVGWLANIPIFLWSGSIMAVNVGGALLPIAISLVALGGSLLPGGNRELAALLLALVAATGALLAVILLLPSSFGSVPFLAVFTGALFVLIFGRKALLPAKHDVGADAIAVYALVAVGIWGTFLGTQVVLGLGIEAGFPAYLVVPVVIGVAAVPLRWPRRDAPALAYAASTLGVLIGADVLHQPGLFAGGPFLGAIGGAGPFDLVFLSGPFALGTAFVIDLSMRRALRGELAKEQAPSSPAVPLPLDPRFTEALSDYASRSYEPVPRKVLAVVDAGIGEARQALGLPTVPVDHALEGLSTHPLLRSDLQNLRALSTTGASGRDDARRAIVTGFLLQRGLLDLLAKRFATSQERVKAYGIDLLLCFFPAIPFLILILSFGHFSDQYDASVSVAYNGAISALGAWPFVLFVLSEAIWGATPGKMLMGLEVVAISGERPTILALLARNVPKVVPLASLSITIGLAVLYLQVPPTSPWFAGALVVAGLAGVALTGLVSVWVMRSSPRRQRLGDVVAETMVWKRAAPLTMGEGTTGPVPPLHSPPVAP